MRSEILKIEAGLSEREFAAVEAFREARMSYDSEFDGPDQIWEQASELATALAESRDEERTRTFVREAIAEHKSSLVACALTAQIVPTRWPIPTWGEEREVLFKVLGYLPDGTVEILRQRGAYERHQARVAAVLDAALAGLTGSDRPSVAAQRAYAYNGPDSDRAWQLGAGTGDTAELVSLLAARLGQMMLVQQAHNQRPGWGARLGKGRRMAMDGNAWDAAVSEATSIVAQLYVRISGSRSETDDQLILLAAKNLPTIWAESAKEFLSRRLTERAQLVINSWRNPGDQTGVSEAIQLAEDIRAIDALCKKARGE